MKIINGKKIADQILDDLRKKIKEKRIKPCLAVILVGDDPASKIYVQLKERAAKRIGVRIVKRFFLAKEGEEILKAIESLNNDSGIDGILIQLPLPKSISTDRIIQAISPEKDVDGLLVGKSPFISAIWRALEATREDLRDKKALVWANSDVFRQKLVSFLEEKGLQEESSLGRADVVIIALGKPGLIKGSMIKQGAILIDGGISKKNGKIEGDIDQESVRDKAKWISPVPGGLGPMTVAFLLSNLVKDSSPFKARP